MKRRKLIALSLVCMMVLLTICSCGNAGKNSQTNNGDNAGGEEKSDSGFVEHIYDMGGKTIRIADSTWKDAPVLDEIEKDYNCKIEVIVPNYTTLAEEISTSAAGGKVYANIINFQREFKNIYMSGHIAEINTIKNLELETNNWLPISKAFGAIGQKQYGISFMRSGVQMLNWNVLAYNKDMAARYGIEDLYEVVRRGEWTYEKFEEVCRTVITKSNGTVQGMINGYNCLPYALMTNNIEPIVLKDGEYTYNCLSDNVLDSLQFYQNFNKNGLLDMKDYVGNNAGLTESNVFMREDVFFHLSDYWVVSDVFAQGMPSDYGILPHPKGPAADDYVGIVSNCKNYCFIKGDPDIEDAAAILVALANRTAITDEEWIEIQIEKNLRDEDSGEMLQIMLDNPRSTAEILSPLGNAWTKYAREVIYEMSLTPRQAMEQAQQGAQAEIDKYYGQ